MKKKLCVVLVFLIFTSCYKDADDKLEIKPQISFYPELVTELIPEDKGSTDDSEDRSINVIQGLAAFDGGWFTSQTSQSKYLIINYLDADGVSKFNIKLNVNSHAQDLSLEQISDTELYLYTSEGHFKDSDVSRGSGMVRLHVTLPPKDASGGRDMSVLTVVVDDTYDLNYINSTPTISEDTTQFAVRSNKTIHVHSRSNIMDGNFNDVDYRFELSKEQLVDNLGGSMWFQGIALKDNLVYCLTGDNEVKSVKKLFVYDTHGVVVSKSTFTYDDFGLEAKEKLEPESLTFVGDDLYMAMMIEKPNGADGNLKFLFKLEKEEN
jgi:hypothetical protein